MLAIVVWFACKWYALTQLVTYKRKVVMSKYTSTRDIAEFLNWGREWKSDPMNGKFDIMVHPTRTQSRIQSGTAIRSVDCDEHMGIWAHALLTSGLARKVWGAFVHYTKSDGKRGGHALILFRGMDGKTYWSDYGIPQEYDGDWEWITPVTDRFRAKVRWAATVEIRGLSSRGRVLFGRTKTVRAKDLA